MVSQHCPSSYRPITLTSCPFKTFQRIVNFWLVFGLELVGCLDRFQCGFLQFRSTIADLAWIEPMICNAFVNIQFCLSVLLIWQRLITPLRGMEFWKIWLQWKSEGQCFHVYYISFKNERLVRVLAKHYTVLSVRKIEVLWAVCSRWPFLPIK